ncbi:BMP family ABC transporter substrate-binding protein [Halobacteriales archaeon QS_1_67_19]|nr:MAG: BMP family ABC transporter substrate-binding protein [Halobacteriales archaeon QS_1_67_19]
MYRRQLLRAAGGLSLTGLGGYLQDDEINVGMVYALGGLGDNSFNDMALGGIQQASEEFGVEFQNAEPGSASDIPSLQRRFARSQNPDYELICTIGFIQKEGLQRNAEQFPDQDFVIVDEVVEQDNVASFVFKEEQGSFQVGHLAGVMTSRDFDVGDGETNDELTVGFVGGREVPLIEKFEAGYRAGVAYADADVEVLSAYAQSFSDPARGREIASSMYEDGADVIYHAAGGTGNGVFRAAEEQGRYAIGVDADQSESISEFSGVIIASMVKRVDQAVFTAVESVVEDSFEGAVNELGLENDGIEAVIGQDFTDEVPEDVTEALAASREAIIDGDIEVPTDPAEVGETTTTAN